MEDIYTRVNQAARVVHRLACKNVPTARRNEAYHWRLNARLSFAYFCACFPGPHCVPARLGDNWLLVMQWAGLSVSDTEWAEDAKVWATMMRGEDNY
jgi:hypothetical protein